MKLKKQLSIFQMLFVFSLPTFFANAQGNPDRLPQYLYEYTSKLSPQKLFIHFDKDEYAAGETIWFKGYLVHGITHEPDTSHANVYLEVFNIQGERMIGSVYQPRAGSFSGDILLPADMPDGNYVLRAYTDWMLNEGEDFLFKKNTYIHNPSFANVIDNTTRDLNKSFNQHLDKLQQLQLMHFFPEGGNLIAGVENRVAVKTTDGTGRGVGASGSIKDQDNRNLVSFQTNEKGFGSFDFVPEQGNAYRAEVLFSGKRPRLFDLPAVVQEGVALRVDMNDEHVIVRISKTGTLDMTYVLLAHTRGQVSFFQSDIKVAGNKTIQIPLTEFPTGVTHFTLFDQEAIPLVERLVFINQDDQAYFDIRALALRTEDAMALNIDLLASDQQGQPIPGNFSASVQYGDVGERNAAENMFTYLFMSSELKGLVQDPAWYFDFEREDIEQDIDLLMMTHGWRRFSWEDVLTPGKPQIAHHPNSGIAVSGLLTSSEDNQGVRNAEVRMRVIDDASKSFTTHTNDRGMFSFDGLMLHDSVLVEVIPPMLAGRQIASVEMIHMGHANFPAQALQYVPGISTSNQRIAARGSNWTRQRLSQEGRSQAGRMSAYGAPDQTINYNENDPYTSIYELLRDKAVGLSISPGGQISIRGPSSINYQGSPIFIIDGVESEGAFMSANIRDIDRIEIFRGASSAAFGARGANGALVAYTKRRDFESEMSGSNMFLISGLGASRTYYVDLDVAFPKVFNTAVQTAHWEPSIHTGEDGLSQFQFFPVPGIGQYRIVIQGIGNDGKIGFGEFIIGQ